MSIVQTVFPLKCCFIVLQVYLYTTNVGGQAISSSRNDTRSRLWSVVIKEIWCAAVGEELSCMREVENYRDPFAVAVVRSGVIVDHVPSLAISRLDALK